VDQTARSRPTHCLDKCGRRIVQVLQYGPEGHEVKAAGFIFGIFYRGEPQPIGIDPVRDRPVAESG